MGRDDEWVGSVEEALAAAELHRALDVLAGVGGESLRQEVILLRGRLAGAEREQRQGLVTAEAARVEQTRLAHAVMATALAATADLPRSQPETRPPREAVPVGLASRQPVFLSHASPDKAHLVGPVNERLQEAGVEVWFDARSMKPGDRLLREIEQALEACPTFVAFITPAFLDSRWARAELDAVRARELADGRQRLVPVLHELTVDEMSAAFPLLADRVALTSTGDVDDLAARLATLVSDPEPGDGA